MVVKYVRINIIRSSIKLLGFLIEGGSYEDFSYFRSTYRKTTSLL